MKRLMNGRVLHGDSSNTPPASAADNAALTEARVNDIVNGALKRFTSQELPKVFEPFAAQFTELKGLLANRAESAPAAGSGGSGGNGGAPASTNTPPASNPQQNAEVLNLTKQIEALRKSQEASENARIEAVNKQRATEKASKVRSALAGMEFATDDAREDAFQILSGMVDFDENDNVVSREGNLPVEVFAKDFIPTKKPYLLAPARAGGSGATGGTPKIGGKAVGLETIRPDMSKDELTAVVAEMRKAAIDLSGGRS